MFILVSDVHGLHGLRVCVCVCVCVCACGNIMFHVAFL